jgi:hypothetical protein
MPLRPECVASEVLTAHPWSSTGGAGGRSCSTNLPGLTLSTLSQQAAALLCPVLHCLTAGSTTAGPAPTCTPGPQHHALPCCHLDGRSTRLAHPAAQAGHRAGVMQPEWRSAPAHRLHTCGISHPPARYPSDPAAAAGLPPGPPAATAAGCFGLRLQDGSAQSGWRRWTRRSTKSASQSPSRQQHRAALSGTLLQPAVSPAEPQAHSTAADARLPGPASAAAAAPAGVRGTRHPADLLMRRLQSGPDSQWREKLGHTHCSSKVMPLVLQASDNHLAAYQCCSAAAVVTEQCSQLGRSF